MQLNGKTGVDPASKIEIVIDNKLEHIKRVADQFNSFARAQNLPDKLRQGIQIVLDDLLNNVVSYAYPEPGQHEIRITAEVATRKLTVTVQDDGIPFNPFETTAPDTNLPLEERQVGGLGIHLVRKFVDESYYQRSARFNLVTLVKNF